MSVTFTVTLDPLPISCDLASIEENTPILAKQVWINDDNDVYQVVDPVGPTSCGTILLTDKKPPAAFVSNFYSASKTFSLKTSDLSLAGTTVTLTYIASYQDTP